MKIFNTTLIILIFALSLTGQRDSVFIDKINESDTITKTQFGGDTTLYIKSTIAGVEFQKIHITSSLKVLLDSLINDTNTRITSLGKQVETNYQYFKEANTNLWNWKRELIRLEEIYNLLY